MGIVWAGAGGTIRRPANKQQIPAESDFMLFPNRFVIFWPVAQFRAAISNLLPAQTKNHRFARIAQRPSRTHPFSPALVPNIEKKSQSIVSELPLPALRR
ncbi:MAG TPA: hypothetical protein VMI53_11770 [Opitutaceae bacterium]|nr:hypothetical protein [Opitutaceae bacterium]